ncbi:uncharacterized protein LOC123902745 [Trifolium pratense]|uniref:Uncharacterized protein n=1 Tax=Trifolium pratense TaxID=57577 RepID=A0ACB0IF37_TRIPR|nr:uncharacterized protein LOC123902745 [Trifolium pratense]CAJ2630570.1 unnamed protein product [Trifolium pratense]
MQTTSLSSFVLLPIPCSGNIKRQSASTFSRNKKSFIHASKRDSFGKHHDGKLVDENMIILRMRIREIKMVETKNEVPSGWTEWEKKHFENYDLDVCEAVGLLQRMLMNTRPGLVVGILVLIMLTMSMSMSLLVVQLVELAKGNII